MTSSSAAIVFLSLDDVLLLHELSLKVFGGQIGIRDVNLLESAVAQPKLGVSTGYVHAFPQEMAAAYGYHLVKNHPFLDGNKRTAWSAVQVFLANNGFFLKLSPPDGIAVVLSIVTGEIDKRQFGKWIEARMVSTR